MSSFIRSKDMTGPKNLELGHVTLATPLSRMTYHRQTGTWCGQPTVHTKCEVSVYNRYKDMKGGAE